MKHIYLLILILLTSLAFGQELPRPKDNKLYTDFTMDKKVAFIKKTIKSTGFIAMKNKDTFVYTQKTPVKLKVKKTSSKIIYQRENDKPLTFNVSDSSMQEGDIAVLFVENTDEIKEKYDVEYKKINENDNFVLTPKNKLSNIKTIEMTGKGDIIKTVVITYKNKTIMSYSFFNTKTGITPDEKYFN